MIWIGIPKVCTNSIGSALYEWATGSEVRGVAAAALGRQKYGAQLAAAEVATLNRGTYRFAFVRNPLERLESLFRNRIGDPRTATAHHTTVAYRAYGLAPGMRFEAFVRAIAKIRDRDAETHFRSQSCFLTHRGRLTVDYLGRFESLNLDWNVLADRFGFPKLPRLNSTRKRMATPSSCTRRTAEMAAERYAGDIARFGYDAVVQDFIDSL